MTLYKNLKVQITLPLLLIVALVATTFTLNLNALEEQRVYNTLLNTTARLQHTARSLGQLAMNYAMNAPQDKASYQRDVKLYYQEMHNQIELFDEITESLMSEQFDPDMTARDALFTPQLAPAVHVAVQAVEETWQDFRNGLNQSIGMDEKGPLLDRAVHYITGNHLALNESIDVLRAQIQRLASSRLEQMRLLYWSTLFAVIAVTLGILAWFFLAILGPLGQAVAGFRKVAQGDFGQQVPVAGSNELASLTVSFNRLSSRLYAIFRLIDRIQQGSDLDETLCFVAEQFPALLPLDWVGALFVVGDSSRITLEKSYRDGRPEVAQRRKFELHKTLLLKTLETDKPLHIPDMQRTADSNPNFQFLNHLVESGLRDAIFLPITEQSPIPGVLAFATRKPDSYTPEHLELLANIAKLVTHSFGRTVKLAEHARLAAIGGFASGIAHEIRSPLSTIGMALEYLRKSNLPEAAEKRAELAQRETGRLARLLEEILLYAKPLELKLQPVDLAEHLSGFLPDHDPVARQRNQRHELYIECDRSTILGDQDRLNQILLNLANNACEAAPDGSVIRWSLSNGPPEHTLTMKVTNPGDPISPQALARLFDPFFTTKANGTGLGLGIVKRMVEAHGGEIHITSDAALGTLVTVQIPLA